jgi:chromate transporter
MVGYAAGLEVGGVPGAILGGVVATAAMVLPAASLVYAITLFWQRAEESRWRIAVEKGFAPLTVGLILASSLVMSRAADHDWRAYLLTAVCTVIFVRTKLNPLLVVAAAGVIGYLGFV